MQCKEEQIKVTGALSYGCALVISSIEWTGRPWQIMWRRTVVS